MMTCPAGCDRHAYCAGVLAALQGMAVVIVAGHDPRDGLPMTYTVAKRLDRTERRYARHRRRDVRAAYWIGAAWGVRREKVREGVLA